MVAANATLGLASAGHAPVEPPWLHTAGQIAGVALMIELLLALLIFAAIMFGLAYAAWWLSQNVVPVIGQYSAQAQEYIAVADRGADRVVHGVATFHGARLGIVAGLKAFFLPSQRPDAGLSAIRPFTSATAAAHSNATPPSTPARSAPPRPAPARPEAAHLLAPTAPIRPHTTVSQSPTHADAVGAATSGLRPEPLSTQAPVEGATPIAAQTNQPLHATAPLTVPHPTPARAIAPHPAPIFRAAGKVAGTAAGRAGGHHG